MKRLTAQDYITGVLAGDRAILARAITLVESSSAEHKAMAQQVLEQILPKTGNAYHLSHGRSATSSIQAANSGAYAYPRFF